VKSDFLTAPTGGAATVGTTGTTDAWGMPVAAASPSQVPIPTIFTYFLSLHLSILFVLFACVMSSKSQEKKKNEFFFLFFGFSIWPSFFPVETLDFLFSFLGFKFIFEVSLKTFELNLSN
jgi:hypothetical protein